MSFMHRQEKKIFAGIDVGSMTAKSVVLDGSGILSSHMIKTGADPQKAGEMVFQAALDRGGFRKSDIGYIVATGYGRISLAFADKKVTEISCHGRGVRYLHPAVETIIDIGGQDSKVIRINGDGSVADFIMNDRCAAGTGRFLEVMARALEVDIPGFGKLALSSKSPCKINSTCIVFAESEVISLLALGNASNNIAAGLTESIARRVGNMTMRLSGTGHMAFVGGVAKNEGMRRALESYLSRRFLDINGDAQLTGAIGAAVIAMEQGLK